MSGYPYGSPNPYGSAPPYGAPYGSATPSYGAAHQPGPYGAHAPGGYGMSPFALLVPSQFAPGTDPNVIVCFRAADRDRSGLIDGKELQQALSGYNQSFSEDSAPPHVSFHKYQCSQDRTKRVRCCFLQSSKLESGRIDFSELRDALLSLGFYVPPVVMDLLVCKFDKSGGQNRAIEYDNFIECCLTVKGLTEKFKEKDMAFSGSATFTHESFMLSVLPFLIA
ncbi:hypothetical protein LUZ60_015557 [Juncus effusus]|nr:hypothetical protein LUZ60_015557 [Juncus effusus]